MTLHRVVTITRVNRCTVCMRDEYRFQGVRTRVRRRRNNSVTRNVFGNPPRRPSGFPLWPASPRENTVAHPVRGETFLLFSSPPPPPPPLPTGFQHDRNVALLVMRSSMSHCHRHCAALVDYRITMSYIIVVS